MDASESDLVERAKRDPDAFGELYERYVDRIYSYTYYRLGDVGEAEDLTAKVFYRAMARIGDYDERGAPFVAWLYRIAHNLIANWYRDRMRRREVSLDHVILLPSREEGPPQAVEKNEDERMLLEAVRKLPDERQQIVILKFVDGLSNAEIGEILGRSESAIKSLYHRTLISLRDELEGRHK